MAGVYDLVERATKFTKSVIALSRRLPKTAENVDFILQLIRSSSSIGANYIEANDALGKRDFLMRVKTARREANETKYWLELITCDAESDMTRKELIDEATQLVKILSTIASKVEAKK